MGIINPKHYDWADSKDTRYSFVNYDLYAKLGLSIRKNLAENKWEIFVIKTGQKKYSGSLEYIVETANELEGAENTSIKGQ